MEVISEAGSKPGTCSRELDQGHEFRDPGLGQKTHCLSQAHDTYRSSLPGSYPVGGSNSASLHP